LRKVLAWEHFNALHVSGDHLFKTFKGSPSGSCITVIMNTTVGLFYLLLGWIDIMDDEIELSDEDFIRYVFACIYGDDLIVAVDKKWEHKFNAFTFSTFMSKHNIKITPANKTKLFGLMNENMKITETTFLKNYFVKHPSRNIWMAALDKSMILDIPNWYRAPCPDKIDQTKIAMDTTCRLAYSWGRDFHSEIKKKCQDWCNERKEILVTPTWDEVDKSCYEDLTLGKSLSWI